MNSERGSHARRVGKADIRLEQAEKEQSMERLMGTGQSGWRALLALIAFVAVALGCAGTPSAPPPPNEAQLLAAGFKIVVATTDEQRMHLRSLDPGRITELQRTGVHFYVYPEPAQSRILVGSPREYEAYLKLRPGTGPSLAQQSAADLANYNKQDAAMDMYTKRDLNDPYYFWPSFYGLWW